MTKRKDHIKVKAKVSRNQKTWEVYRCLVNSGRIALAADACISLWSLEPLEMLLQLVDVVILLCPAVSNHRAEKNVI